MVSREFIVDALGIGSALWLAGYLSSILLYFFMPKHLIGWVLFMVFAPVTVYVACWRFRGRDRGLRYFLAVAAVWTLIAMVLDYFLIVRLFSATDYYQIDVCLYYAVTFLIPVGVGLVYSRRA